MSIQNIIKKHQLETLYKKGTIGVEREGLRTEKNGQLALTDHPHTLGDRSYHPYIQTDFSEAQPELITSVHEQTSETYRQLLAIHDVLQSNLKADELLWPYSMPAALPADENEIPIIRVKDQSAIDYRERLAEKYGKRKQVVSGIHFNYGFSAEFIEAYAKASDLTIKEANNYVHMKLARQFIKHRWFLTYLFGASPAALESFYHDDEARPTDYVRSIRSSSFGYHNELPVQVSYESIEEYTKNILELVDSGHLSQEREFYGAARARGAGTISSILENGVYYIELRSLDNNPLDPAGISEDQLRFVQLFSQLLVWLEEDDLSTDALIKGNEMNEKTALESPFDKSKYQVEGFNLLNEMQAMMDALHMKEGDFTLLEKARHAFENPNETLAAQLVRKIKIAGGFLEHGLTLAEEQKEFYTEKPYLLSGYETMEMSTQLMMFDAIQYGVEVEIIDEAEQFIRLAHGDHVEYVQKGNKSSKDNYVSQLMMDNKTVTKKVLHRHGFNVPQGFESHAIDEALERYSEIQNKTVVIKPKSTNFGIGITVFNQPPSQEDYAQALEFAFKEDDTVLVEEYIAGTEYRFFVLDGETIAVLLRVPAHVIGDGKSTVDELVDDKNADPLRGEGHRSPLEKIAKGEIEIFTLKEQGYTFESIVPEGEIAYLRTSSNISQGGDSIDYTDKMHPAYKQVAADIAEVLGAKISGIDLIIPDYTVAPEDTEGRAYVCLEANWNPAMHMHQYVAKGEGQHVTKRILAYLFEELDIK